MSMNTAFARRCAYRRVAMGDRFLQACATARTLAVQGHAVR
jgi:hypothetical protein